MSRSSFALLTLLASLAGPLLFAPRVRAETTALPCPAEAYTAGTPSVCTPPVASVHPADQETRPAPAADAPVVFEEPAEDWRDFVVENQASSLTNQYDDLFESLGDTVKANQSVKVEAADADSYRADAPNAPKYDPYAGAQSQVEAYESKFSGYSTTDYLRDNFDYKAFTHEVRPAEKELVFAVIVRNWWEDAQDSDLAADLSALSSDAYYLVQRLQCEYSLASIIEHSELAWDRLEEHQRLTRAEIPLQDEVIEIGFRLADDDCGWDCWHEMRDASLASAPAAPTTPAAPASTQVLDREAARSLALSLRRAAAQLEAASNWIAQMGGLDVAELQSDKTSR